VLNLTPMPHERYRVGLPRHGKWREVLNSDGAIYGGGNRGNFGEVFANERKWHNQNFSAEIYLPPLSVVVFQPEA